MKKLSLLVIVLMFAFVIPFTSCKKDEKEAPKLPPQSGFVMDMSGFEGGKKSSAFTGGNWGWAALNVTVWNTILTVNLAVPVASFKEAFKHSAVYDGTTQSWVWAYDVPVGNDMYRAELYGKFVAEGVRWDMYISKTGSYTDFLWYYGVSNVAATSGYWMLKHSPQNNQDFIKIDWNKTSDAIADIKYENVLNGTAEKGTYIIHRINTESDYNAFYDIFTAQNSNLVEIKWHRTNENGRIKDPAHFGNANWYCWDTNHMDIVCP